MPGRPRSKARDEARIAERFLGHGDRDRGSALHRSRPPPPGSSWAPRRHLPSASSHPAGTIPRTLRRLRRSARAAPALPATGGGPPSAGPPAATNRAPLDTTMRAARPATAVPTVDHGVSATLGSAPHRRAPRQSGHPHGNRRARPDIAPRALLPGATRRDRA